MFGMFMQTAYDPSDLIPATWTAAEVFGGVAGILTNGLFLGAIVVGVAIQLGPKVFRRIKGTVSR
jgi:hypothetical protein